MAATVVSYIQSARSGGKFVVLVSDENPEDGRIVFSDFTRDFQHHDIVRRYERTRRPLREDDLRVAGGGWWRLEGDMLVLYGQSAAYGRFDPVWLRRHLAPGMVGTEKRVDVL